MSIAKRTSVLVMVLVLLLALTLPLPAFAVDPMTTAMAANAFAQAIAAYGASQGVSVTFDTASTDGIGEGMHDLWSQFRASVNESDDYESAAQSFQNSHPYAKTSVYVAGQLMDVVGINIDEDIKPALDDFYNWLLSGPAEMVKVDNSYYQFSQAQIGSNATPLNVFTGTGIPTLPILIQGLSNQQYFEGSLPAMQCERHYNNKTWTNTYGVFSYNEVFYVVSIPSSHGFAVIINQSNKTARYALRQYGNGADDYSNISMSATSYVPNHSGWYYNLLSVNDYPGTTFNNFEYYVPSYPSVEAAVDDLVAGVPADTIGVSAYNPDGIATVPDTTDPNYDAIHPTIPVDTPWDDTLYGDGTGVLTDEQTQALVDDLTDALEREGTVELVEAENPPVDPDPPPIGEVMFPMIPITLPSFNFSLSGIWHYVREWIASLGAWFGMVLTMWGILPWAIVVPVYASLVVVIVLGIYKRFFM